jgi:hypothetical protein
MAEGEGRTLEEAFDEYAKKKSAEVLGQHNVDEISFARGLEIFEEYHPVQIQVKTRPANQWVKGFKVSDTDI